MDKRFAIVGMVLAIVATGMSVVQVLFNSSSEKYLVGIIAIFTILISSFLFFALRILERNPTLVTICLLGFPRTGKTVYLTALFDELQQAKQAGVQFSPYGRETVEEVTKNLNRLSKGSWLPATRPGEVFFYRALASIGSGILARRYKIEVADFAGENIGELNPSHEKWLHKTDYFKQVIMSDAVILALDTGVLLDGSAEEIEEIQNAFVAAFQILAQEKGATDSRKLKTPVAILFLKADLAREERADLEEAVAQSVPRLIHVCKSRCRYFKYFFVSSVGSIGIDGSPPTALRPEGVVEPLVWLLRRAGRTS